MVPAVAATCTINISSGAEGFALGYQSVKAYGAFLVVCGTRLVGLNMFIAKGFVCADILILCTVLDATVGVKSIATSIKAATNVGPRFGAVETYLEK